MILAIYSKYKQNDKWLLHAVAKNVEAANKEVKKIINVAKKIGYDDANAIVQPFDCFDNIPGTLEADKIVPTSRIYN